jgi:hypothetical protein
MPWRERRRGLRRLGRRKIAPGDGLRLIVVAVNELAFYTATGDRKQRGGSYQVRVYGGRDPQTGKQLILIGSATNKAGAIWRPESRHLMLRRLN